MSLLYEFVASLTDEEIHSLQTFVLNGHEQQLLKHALRTRHDPMRWAGAQFELEISDVHLRKLQSVLLQKCYKRLIPPGGRHLLSFLASKKILVRQLVNEIQRQEKSVKAKEKKSFFQDAARMLLRLPPAHIPVDFLVETENKLLRELQANRVCPEHVFIAGYKLYLHFMQRANDMSLYTEPVRGHVLEQAFELEKLAHKSKEPEAMLDAYIGILRVLKFLGDDREEKYMALAMAICNKHSKKIAAARISEVQLLHAEFLYHYRSDFEAALSAYRGIIQHMGEANVSPYHRTAYIELCMICGQLAELPAQLDFTFGIYTQTSGKTMTSSALLVYAKYFLISRQFDHAWTCLRKGIVQVNKNTNRLQEIQFRNLELSYFMLQGDYERAHQLADKNIKFVQSKKLKLHDANFAQFYLLAKAIIDSKQTGKPLNEKHRAVYTEWQKGNYNVYGRLLQMMME